MSAGPGDTVGVPDAAVGTAPHDLAQGSARFMAAFGGAVVVVWLLVLGSVWSTGLRASTFEALRSDIASGSVTEWYAASSLDKGILDRPRAEQAGTSGGVAAQDEERAFVTPEDFPDGGILVWRTSGAPGWSVASPDGFVNATTSAAPTEESTALVRQLRDAEVPTQPFRFPDTSALEWIYLLGGVLVFLRLVAGAPPRVGTRWFWFWLFVTAPLALGFVAYAVTELVGLRRRPDRPSGQRFRWIFGFLAGVLLSIAAALVAQLLRSRGVPLPL